MNTPRQLAFPSVNETAVAKAAQRRATIFTGRKQLMKDLHCVYDPFLKTSFGHSPQKLRYAVQEINDRLGTGKLFDADIADLCLLTKYIESDYQRVKLPYAFAGEREDARQATSAALLRLGDYLTARKRELISANPGARQTDANLADPPLLTLAKTWLQALGIMVRKHPTGDYVEKNYKNLRMLMMHFLTSAQFQRMSDYASSNCFIALRNLINSVPSTAALINFYIPSKSSSRALSSKRSKHHWNLPQQDKMSMLWIICVAQWMLIPPWPSE